MDPTSIGLGELQQYLGDVNFPAGKEEVASGAESNGAPQNLVEQIRNSAQERFSGIEDVQQAVQGSL